jgi:dihydrofolate synthase/folylpolyglutamate synthase
MDYLAAVRWLYGLEPRGIRLELDRMRAALALRGDPQRALRVVHVAGTNGKGSVSAMVAASLRAAGLRVGLYTSPHLHRFVERIRIDGRPLGERALARRVTELRTFLESPGAPPLTFFEVATLLAFEVFRDAQVDVAVLEVGLGGRLDATNVLESPLVCAITRIARDHEMYLGDTLAKIATEKAGIVRPGVPLIMGARDPEARAAIEARARAVGAAPLLRNDAEIDVRSAPRGRLVVQVGDVRLDGLRPALAGAHQHENVGVAVGVLVALRARGVAVSDDAIRAGIARVRWPGRLERATRGGTRYLFDAAHNPDGCEALARTLAAMPRRGRRVLLFAAMRDKDHGQMLASVAPHCDGVVYARPATPRAAEPEELAASWPGECARDVRAALARARALAGPGGTVVVAGSIYLLAAARAAALGVRTEPPIAM